MKKHNQNKIYRHSKPVIITTDRYEELTKAEEKLNLVINLIKNMGIYDLRPSLIAALDMDLPATNSQEVE